MPTPALVCRSFAHSCPRALVLSALLASNLRSQISSFDSMKDKLWPHKNGLGIQLTHGIAGNSLLLPSKTKAGRDVKIRNPKLDEVPLSKVTQRPKQLVKLLVTASTTSISFSVHEKVATLVKSINFVGPQDLLTNLDKASEPLATYASFDPTQGKTFRLFFFYSKCLVLYPSGEYGQNLNVAFVEASTPIDCPLGQKAYTPKFHKILTLALKQPIKQIEPFENKIAVRTGTCIYIFHVAKKSKFKLSLVYQFRTGEFKKLAFADITWSPINVNYLIIVDIRGNLFQVEMTNNISPRVHELVFQPDSLELSNWRKVIWASKSVVYVASRSALWRFDILEDTRDKILTAEVFTKIQDIHVPKYQSKWMFLLTSREVIWIDISGEKPTRLVSWKHFLEDLDPSLKLAVGQDGNDYSCLIYSQNSPLVINLNFGIRGGYPCCLSSPSLIDVSGKQESIQDLAIVELDDYFYGDPNLQIKSVFGLFDLRVNMEINFNILMHVDMEESQNQFDYSRLRKDTKIPAARRGTHFEMFSKAKMLPLTKSLYLLEQDDGADDYNEVQSFAWDLSEYKNSVEASRSFSLLDITKKLPKGIADVSELDNMLEQLRDHFKENGLDLSSTIQHHVPGSTATIEGVYDHLKSYYSEVSEHNREAAFKQLAIILASSSTKVTPTDIEEYYAKDADEAYNNACSSAKAILKDWDDEVEDVPTVIDSSQFQPSQIEAPTISIASQERQRPKKLKKKHDMRRQVLMSSQPSQPSQSQPSQAEAPPLSQMSLSQVSQVSQLTQKRTLRSQSSQTSRKKKKRGGFA